MKKDFARGYMTGAISLLLLAICIIAGGTFSVVRIVRSFANTFDVLSFVQNVISLLVYVSLIIYGFYSYKKGIAWLYGVLGAFLVYVTTDGILFRNQTKLEPRSFMDCLLMILSVVSICSIVGSAFTLTKRKKAMLVMLIMCVCSIASSAINCIYADFSAFNGFDVFLKYCGCFSGTVLSVSIMCSYLLMGTKKIRNEEI